MSKAFLKSTNKARTEPLLSRVCIHFGGHVTDDVTWPPKVLWCSTVGYPVSYRQLVFLFICYYCAIVIVVTVFICTCFLFCIANYCYSAIRLLSRKCGIKLSVIVKRVACACVGCPLYCSKCSQRNGVVGCNENKCYWKYGRAADGTCQSKTGLHLNLMAFYPWLAASWQGRFVGLTTIGCCLIFDAMIPPLCIWSLQIYSKYFTLGRCGVGKSSTRRGVLAYVGLQIKLCDTWSGETRSFEMACHEELIWL